MVALLADGVDLIDEHDAGSLFFCLLKEIAHLGRAQPHKHFHELGAGDGEKGHLGFAGHCLGQQGFACAWRPHQKRSLG